MPDSDFVEVRLLQFPLALWQRNREHVDELLREFALIAESEERHRSVPDRLLDLVTGLNAAHAGGVAPAETVQEDALLRGESEIDLVYDVPAGASETIRHLGDMPDEADEFCREGGHLLTLQTPPDQLAFRQWVLSQFLAQLAGDAPTSWPEFATAP